VIAVYPNSPVRFETFRWPRARIAGRQRKGRPGGGDQVLLASDAQLLAVHYTFDFASRPVGQ
jgi:hypothetical protein